MFCFSSPATRRIGRVYSRSSCSVSVSLRAVGPLFSWSSARTEASGESARARAIVTAVNPDVLLRSVRSKSMDGLGSPVLYLAIGYLAIGYLAIGGRPNTGYPLTNHGMRLVWGAPPEGRFKSRNSRYRCAKRP